MHMDKLLLIYLAKRNNVAYSKTALPRITFHHLQK
jgi:hypothetical protein